MYFYLEVLPILLFIMISVNSLECGQVLQVYQMKLTFQGMLHKLGIMNDVLFL